MNYLEKNDFLHRNLCACSILVGHHLTIKVSNFKQAVEVIEEKYTDSRSYQEVLKEGQSISAHYILVTVDIFI